MSVIDSIKQALGGSRTDDPTNAVTYHCQFCDEEYDTHPGFCENCGSERITETA